MRTYTFRLTEAELFALRSIVAEHLLCPTHSEVHIYCGVQPAVEVTPEELLSKLLDGPRLVGAQP